MVRDSCWYRRWKKYKLSFTAFHQDGLRITKKLEFSGNKEKVGLWAINGVTSDHYGHCVWMVHVSIWKQQLTSWCDQAHVSAGVGARRALTGVGSGAPTWSGRNSSVSSTKWSDSRRSGTKHWVTLRRGGPRIIWRRWTRHMLGLLRSEVTAHRALKALLSDSRPPPWALQHRAMLFRFSSRPFHSLASLFCWS